MKLVDASEVSNEEQAIQRLLEDNPGLLFQVARLMNGYRDLVRNYLSDEQPDPSDTLRALTKKENSMRRLGIPIFETLEDWQKLREMRDATQHP